MASSAAMQPVAAAVATVAMAVMVLMAHTFLLKPPIMAAMAVVEAMEVTDIRLPVLNHPVVVVAVTAVMPLVQVAVAMVLLITAKAATVVKTARMEFA